MRYFWTWLLLWLNALSAQAQAPTLQQARQRWLHGNYEESRELYETLAKDPKLQVPALVGLSRSWQSKGAFDKALEVIGAGIVSQPDASDLHARRAELLYLRGRWEDAEKTADKIVKDWEAANAKTAPANTKGRITVPRATYPVFLARWVRGQIYRDRADFRRADAEFRWFVRHYSDRSNQDDDIKDPEELLLVGLAATENARWHNLSDQFRVILTDVYGEALKSDKDFWPAEYQSGLLLLEKYNQPEALDAFNKALVINPNAAEAQVGRGRAAFQKYELQTAEHLAEQALHINPNLPEALRLRADLHLMAGDLHAAAQDLEHARKTNPRDETTLGRIAARLHMAKDQAALDALVREVKRFDAKPGLFYHELAERLEQRRDFDAAERYYKAATELRPMLPWPLNGLGLLYMRLGREKEAEEVLTRAFKADEFNVRVSNTLKVLRHLEKYETLKTAHFLIRYDPQNDPRLARYMASYLEEIYADLAARFRYTPTGPIRIEVFNNHEMFSGRTVALPDLHTIGACTGRVVALVSPNGKGIAHPFNWARVLRHELVHIFNLEQTSFQVPHWLTEGLAVNNEGFPRPQQWNQLLRQRVPADDLMNLDNIDLGFIRPWSPLDWHMAYCQSQLYVDYLKEKFGPGSIGELLQEYGRGLDTGAAISKVCQVDKKSFEAGYRAYLAEVVKSLQGRPPDKRMTYSQLQKAHESNPEDVDVASRLAEQYLIRRDRKEARRLADSVLALRSNHALACYVKARLLRDAGDDDEALKLLEGALDRASPEPKVVQTLGTLYYEAQKFDKAAQVYELAHKAEPYEGKWLVELARVYSQTGDKAKKIEVLSKLVPTDADNLEQRKVLTKLLLEAGRFAEAERYAKEALEIDVRDVEARDALEKALVEQNKSQEAAKLRELLEKK
jgi:tetratricopeptide (TPR) repeat protein